MKLLLAIGISPLQARELDYPMNSNSFWEKHPALLIGLLLLLGTAWALNLHPIYPCLALFLNFSAISPPHTLAKKLKSLLYRCLPFCIAWGWAHHHLPSLSCPATGTGEFTINSIQKSRSPFCKSLVYRGTLTHFSAQENISLRNCFLYLPSTSSRLFADKTYKITGTLQQKGPLAFTFKSSKNAPPSPIASASPFPEWRYRAKQAVYSHLKKHFKNTHVLHFLNALITGDIEEQSLSLEFNHLGLQHILSISGFHFVLIALFLRALLHPFLRPKNLTFCLLLLLTFYFLFLGEAPSIERAWIAIVVFLIGQLLHLRITPLNALGVSLCIEILRHPLQITHLGFCLSFLCTLSILLFYPMAHHLCQKLLPSRSFEEVKKMDPLNQHGFLLSAFLRKSLALTLSINITALPVLLFLFHRFPLLSLIYNIFFPLWTALSLILLICGLLLTPLPYLNVWLHQLNELWTQAGLTITAHPPALLNGIVRCPSIPYEGLLCYLTLIFFLGAYRATKHPHLIK